MEEYKSLQELKAQMDFQIKMESSMHDHRDDNNWEVGNKVLPYSTEKKVEKGGANFARVTTKQCKQCGQVEVDVKSLESTKSKEKDEPKPVKRNWFKW